MVTDILRIEKQPRKAGGPRIVYVRKCLHKDCNSEIKTRASYKGSSGMCQMHAQRKRPFESIYNGIKNDWRGTEVSLTYEEYLEFTKIPNCHYCNLPIPWQAYGPRAYYLDRKDNDKGYSKENCVACCTECNIAKGNRYTYEEWKAAMKAVLEVRNGAVDRKVQRVR